MGSEPRRARIAGNPRGNRQRIIGVICAADNGLSEATIRELAAPPRTNEEVHRCLQAYRRAGLIRLQHGKWHATRKGMAERATWKVHRVKTPRRRTRHITAAIDQLFQGGPLPASIAHQRLKALGWGQKQITSAFRRRGVVSVNNNGVKWRARRWQVEDIPGTWGRDRLTHRLVTECGTTHAAVRAALYARGPAPIAGYSLDDIADIIQQLKGAKCSTDTGRPSQPSSSRSSDSPSSTG